MLKKRKCRDCDFEVGEGDESCPSCGKKVEEEW
jgi:RNA polymerase subunit RPABC4/transcription elongation factor Spt4